jgi:hypothetical protein
VQRMSSTTGWTLHDLRRSAATNLARLGVAPHILERILNHTSGNFGGVARVYNRFQYVDEMRAALQSWDQHILLLRENSRHLRSISLSDHSPIGAVAISNHALSSD